MLCNNSYPQPYVDDCRSAVAQLLATYAALSEAIAGVEDEAPRSALLAFEPHLFNQMVLALDHYFVHRGRGQELKDGNPLNEVRVIGSSLLENHGRLASEKSIRLTPETSILHLQVGDRITLGADDFATLSEAFFTEIERKYVQPAGV